MGSCLSCILHCCGKQDETSQVKLNYCVFFFSTNNQFASEKKLIFQYGETNDRTQLIDPNNDNVTIQGIQR